MQSIKRRRIKKEKTRRIPKKDRKRRNRIKNSQIK